MRISRPVCFPVLILVVLALLAILPAVAFAESDQAAAERILGAQWKQLSARAGIVFAGTVLSGGADSAGTDRPVPSVALRFRVDRAIAGVDPGQTLTIHEWIGAWLEQTPMHRGDRFLLFLYPPSYLGLTSPIGGRRGQIRLDSAGQIILGRSALPGKQTAMQPVSSSSSRFPRASVTLDQLTRAIRSARGN
jgi:hypothetical protein